jgi:hypothetical protein
VLLHIIRKLLDIRRVKMGKLKISGEWMEENRTLVRAFVIFIIGVIVGAFFFSGCSCSKEPEYTGAQLEDYVKQTLDAANSRIASLETLQQTRTAEIKEARAEEEEKVKKLIEDTGLGSEEKAAAVLKLVKNSKESRNELLSGEEFIRALYELKTACNKILDKKETEDLLAEAKKAKTDQDFKKILEKYDR